LGTVDAAIFNTPQKPQGIRSKHSSLIAPAAATPADE